ncbi:hypothetical protein SALBM311S_09258 [Streptomyces alboniger]
MAGPGELLGGGEACGAGPDAATVLPDSRSGICGATSPVSHALSMIETSTFLMATAVDARITHADSQGAGHSRPVNSGKLFVACRRSEAAAQSSR